jgi:glycosyltransferase involved in cell wall biosynthesis
LDIVHVAGKNPFAAAPSGTSTYIAGLLNRLHYKGLKLTLISTDITASELGNYKINHIPIKVRRQTSIAFLARLLVKAPFLGLSKNSIIHTHRPDFMFPFVLFNRRNKKVCTLHGPPEIGIKTRKHGLVWRLYSVLEKLSLNHIDRYIAVNREAMDYYTEKEPRLTGKISVIPVGIDCNKFKPLDREVMREKYGFNQKDTVILFIGRFSVEKGLDLLLKAFSEVRAAVPTAKLVLLGSGPDKENLEKIITDKKIEGVTFMKPVLHNQIPDIMNCANVFALCSLYEGMPTVVLEALACGVPVVATDVGDVSCVVKDGETGILVKERNSNQIGDGLLRVIKMGRESYSQKCIEAAGAYSWDNVTEKVLNVYSELRGMDRGEEY